MQFDFTVRSGRKWTIIIIIIIIISLIRTICQSDAVCAVRHRLDLRRASSRAHQQMAAAQQPLRGVRGRQGLPQDLRRSHRAQRRRAGTHSGVA